MMEKVFLCPSREEREEGKAEPSRQCIHRQTAVVSTCSLCQPGSDFDDFPATYRLLSYSADCFYGCLTYLHRDVLLLAGFLWGEDIRDFFVRCGLAANGTLNGASVRPHAVLLDNNWNAFITETVPTGQDCPLKRKTHRTHLSEMLAEMPSKYTCIKGEESHNFTS